MITDAIPSNISQGGCMKKGMSKFIITGVILLFITLTSAQIIGQHNFDDSHWSDQFDMTSINIKGGEINKLYEANNLLYIGFDQRYCIFGHPEANGIVAWDGDKFYPLGNGVRFIINSIIEYNDKIIAAGCYSTKFNLYGRLDSLSIAAWDGNDWTNFENGINGTILDMAIYNNQLIVAGFFKKSGYPELINIAAWDGQKWMALGGGLSDTVFNLEVYHGKLIAGGRFVKAGDIDARLLATWDGTNWSAFDEPIDRPVKGLKVWNDKVYIGYNTYFDGSYIYSWDEISGLKQVKHFSIPNLNVLDVYNDWLVVGSNGYIDSIYNSTAVYYDGQNWGQLGDGQFCNSITNTISSYKDKLIIGGDFYTDDNCYNSLISILENDKWTYPYGLGVDQTVNDMIIYDDQLIVCGNFNKAGNRGISFVAAFDGKEWSPLGSNENIGFCATTMEIYNDELYVSGVFSKIGGKEIINNAVWNGKNWRPMLGEDTLAEIYDLQVFDNQLFACGNFYLDTILYYNSIANFGIINGDDVSLYELDNVQIYADFSIYNDQLYGIGSYYDSLHKVGRDVFLWDGQS